MKQRFLVLSLLLVFGLVLATPAVADNLYASIRGTVADPTGAMMTGVKVSATNVATGLNYTTTTNKDGVYTFLQLQIGDYTVRAEQTGFKKYQASGIHPVSYTHLTLPTILRV